MTDQEFKKVVADLATTKDPLKLTVVQMLSDDPDERFRAEYKQLKIRIERLTQSLDHWDEFKKARKIKASKAALSTQLYYMRGLLDLLTSRAKIENIKLDE